MCITGFVGAKRKYDVVTDGNQPLRRKLSTGESTTKRLPGAPKKAKSRCAAKTQGREEIPYSRTQTGGLFCTVNAKQVAYNKGYQILHLAEMLDGESTFIKRTCLEDMRKTNILVGRGK